MSVEQEAEEVAAALYLSMGDQVILTVRADGDVSAGQRLARARAVEPRFVRPE